MSPGESDRQLPLPFHIQILQSGEPISVADSKYFLALLRSVFLFYFKFLIRIWDKEGKSSF